MSGRPMPADYRAEQEVLGACMQQPGLVGELGLSGADFYDPRHELIWRTLQELAKADAPTTMSAAFSRLEERGQLGKVGGGPGLHDLVMTAAVPGQAEYFAGQLREKTARRQVIEAATRLLQASYESAAPIEEIVSEGESALAGAVSTSEADVDDVVTLDEMADVVIGDDDWIIPHLLDRGDRLIITGAEGLGKSVLTRQLAVCVAAGVDPFTGKAIPPKKALVIDCENPQKIMKNSFAVLRDAIRAHGASTDNRLLIKRRPDGMDLADPAQQLWLERLVRLVSPDLLVIGPVYKMHTGGADREEDLARRVTSVLDRLRSTGNFALVLEHHAPHHAQGSKARTVRPIGSSLWMRWPEFGIGLRLVDGDTRRLVDVLHWRGPREERPWPTQLESGAEGMPWVEVFDHRRSA